MSSMTNIKQYLKQTFYPTIVYTLEEVDQRIEEIHLAIEAEQDAILEAHSMSKDEFNARFDHSEAWYCQQIDELIPHDLLV